jgi:hypothetical protein
MVRYVLLRPLRPELDVITNNCRVRFVGISRYVHFYNNMKNNKVKTKPLELYEPHFMNLNHVLKKDLFSI